MEVLLILATKKTKHRVQPDVVVPVDTLVLQVHGRMPFQRMNAFLILAELQYVDAE